MSPKREGRVIIPVLSPPFVIIPLIFVYSWLTALIFIIFSILPAIGMILRPPLIAVS